MLGIPERMIEDELAAWLEYRKLIEGKGEGDIYESELSEDEIMEQLDQELGSFDTGRGVGRPAGDDWQELSVDELLREVEGLAP